MAFSGSVIKLATGTAIAQGIAVITIPIVTRFFGPDTFGVFGIFMSFSIVLGSIACFRYELSIMLPKDDEDAANLVAASIAIACITSFLIGIFLIISGDFVINSFNIQSFDNYLSLLPVMVLLIALTQVVNVWKSRENAFGTISISRVIQTITSQSIAIFCGLIQMVAGGYLIASRIAGQLSAIAFLVAKDCTSFQALLHKVSFAKMVEGLKRYRNFPKYTAWSGLLISFSMELPIILMAMKFDAYVVGSFVLIRQVLRMPYTFVGVPASQVLFQSTSVMCRERKEISRLVKDLYERLIIISAFPILALSIIGKDIFVLVFGREWEGAGQMAQIYCIAAFAEFNLAPFGCLFNVLEKQKKGLLFDFSLMVFRFVFLTTGIILGDAFLAVALFTFGDILGRVIKFQWIFKNLNFYMKNMATLLLPSLRLSVIFFLMLFVQTLFQIKPVYILITYGICGILYFSAVHLFYKPLTELVRD